MPILYITRVLRLAYGNSPRRLFPILGGSYRPRIRILELALIGPRAPRVALRYRIERVLAIVETLIGFLL